MHKARTRLAQAWGWSSDSGYRWIDLITAGAGMAGPVAVGAASGHVGYGLAAAVGALAIDASGTATHSARQRALMTGCGVVILASMAVLASARLPAPGDLVLIAIAVGAAIIGSYSRPLAIATTRLVVFLVILNALASGRTNAGPVALLATVGACWTVFVGGLLGTLALRSQGKPPRDPVRASISWQPRIRRLRQALERPTGWPYVLRLGACLGAASGMARLWPGHHMYWVALTVALLLERRVDALPLRTLQRALGTAAGLVIAGLLFAGPISQWPLVASIALLAVARPIARAHNYLLYTALMTPLIVLLLDAGHGAGTAVLIDRLAATLLGALLVIMANQITLAWAARPGH